MPEEIMDLIQVSQFIVRKRGLGYNGGVFIIVNNLSSMNPMKLRFGSKVH